jgi:RNA polymerase sigma-70 factor (ECF subfamily)
VQEQEFRQIYDAYSRKLYNYILWMTRNSQVSQDILQIVFVKVWRHPRCPSSGNELEPWLYTVARNACMDTFRSQGRHRRLRADYASQAEEPTGDGGEEGRGAWSMLSMLSEEERSILYMHFKIGYNYRDIGRVLDMEENAVRVKAFRAIRRLRERYAKGSA